jgi:hypothetical protein
MTIRPTAEHRRLYEAKLASYALTPEDAEYMGWRLDYREWSGQRVPVIHIAHRDTLGRLQPGKYTLRFLTPAYDSAGKLRRFDFPKNGDAPIFLPHLKRTLNWPYAEDMGIDELREDQIENKAWDYIKNATHIPICIVEGQGKAAALQKHTGNFTIGLAGKDNFRKRDAPSGVHPDALVFIQSRAEVTFFADSDYFTNSSVKESNDTLAESITNVGGTPRVVHIPALSGLEKTGVDDFILHKDGGVAKLQALISARTLYHVADELQQMNEKYIHILRPSVYVHRDSGYLHTKQEMQTNLESYTVVAQDGGKLRPMKLFDRWSAWPHHATADTMTFLPGVASTPQAYNRHSPAVMPRAARGDNTPWHHLFNHVTKYWTPAERLWFAQYTAFPFQYPGVKIASAPFIWSNTKGVGKSLLGEIVCLAYGPYANWDVTEDELFAPFNQWMVDKQFVVINELRSAEGRKEISRKLHTLITSATLSINIKGVRQYVMPNVMHLYIFANFITSLIMEQAERRFFNKQANEGRISGTPISLHYQNKHHQLNPHTVGAWVYEMQHLSLKGFDPTAPAPVTSDQEMAQEISESDLTQWLRRVFGGEVRIAPGKKESPRELYSARELFNAYMREPHANRFTSARSISSTLVQMGVKPAGGMKVLLVSHTSPVSYYPVRNLKRWASAKHKEIVGHIRKHTLP